MVHIVTNKSENVIANYLNGDLLADKLKCAGSVALDNTCVVFNYVLTEIAYQYGYNSCCLSRNVPLSDSHIWYLTIMILRRMR